VELAEAQTETKVAELLYLEPQTQAAEVAEVLEQMVDQAL
jgi:hypothetical protein